MARIKHIPAAAFYYAQSLRRLQDLSIREACARALVHVRLKPGRLERFRKDYSEFEKTGKLPPRVLPAELDEHLKQARELAADAEAARRVYARAKELAAEAGIEDFSAAGLEAAAAPIRARLNQPTTVPLINVSDETLPAFRDAYFKEKESVGPERLLLEALQILRFHAVE